MEELSQQVDGMAGQLSIHCEITNLLYVITGYIYMAARKAKYWLLFITIQKA